MLESYHQRFLPRSVLVAVLTVAAVTALPDPASHAADYEWVNVTMTAEFAPRDGAGALSYKSRMWLLGGWNPRHAASVFVHDDALWMVAGNNMQSDVWKLVRTTKAENQ